MYFSDNCFYAFIATKHYIMRTFLLVIVTFFTFPFTILAQKDTAITSKVRIAAELADLSFTQQELDSMQDGITQFLHTYQSLHKHALPNDVPMSLWQSPTVAGMHFSNIQMPIEWVKPQNIHLPANINALAYYSIPQLAYLIQHKKISSVALTKFFIQRIKQYGDTLQCVITLTEDLALQQAAQADAEIAAGNYKGMLHGIPYGLKDLFAVKGYKTTWGAAPYKNQEINEDAFVYQQLRKAGAVLVAKFSLGALAMGDYWYGGRTKNPWDLTRGSSGSSAGPAAATAAGLVPFAIGTETWGSIVSPSATCGVTGLRPTFGSISRTGAMVLSWSLDKIGPICRSANDAAIVFHAIHGTDGIDQSAVNMPFNYTPNKPINTYKIAYAKNYFDKITDTSRNEWKVLETFKKMGVQLIPINFPDSDIYHTNLMSIVIGAECAAAFDDFTRSNLDDEMTRQGKYDWPNQFREARLIPAVEYINANRHRYLLMQQVNALLQKYDAVICPTRGSGNQSAITNLTGNPVVCVPTGFDNRFHLPTSISFIGNLYDEGTLLRIAKAYQDATPWNKTYPTLFQ